jgi:hypothetical protein
MKGLVLVGAAALMTAAASQSVYATPIEDPLLSFGITGVGGYTVNTGNITSATATKTIPTTELIGGTTTPATFALAGLVTGAAATYSTFSFPTAVGPVSFTLATGDLTFTFTSISSALIVPSGATSNGSISEQFNGTVTGDTSVGQTFLHQTASISETCTQTSIGASITCSESVITPGLPTTVPEPGSLALLGTGLGVLGWVGWRRRAKQSTA